MLAELLSDENNASIKVVRFSGIDKTKMLSRNEYGFKCLLISMQEANDYVISLNETSINENHIIVTIPFAFAPSMKQVDVNGLSPVQTKILMAIKENPTFTMKDIAALCQLGTTRVGEVIKSLKEIGKLERIGANKGGYWKIN